jgi:hypothetical protein
MVGKMQGGIGADGGFVGTAPWHVPAKARGFTDTDLKMLREAHREGAVSRGWGRAEFVVRSFGHYFAIWGNSHPEGDLPALSIVRFDANGTYALLLRDKFIANGKALNDVLRTLLALGAVATDGMVAADGAAAIDG